MSLNELAGKPAPFEHLENIPRLVSCYYTNKPDPNTREHNVSFGTSGHRGSSFTHTFNEDHVLSICQAICEYKQSKGYSGPLFIGMDTHALSEPAMRSAVEVFAGNQVTIKLQAGLGYTPTPVISHAILTYNRGRTSGLADGVIITPSHNPPADGGLKYNPPSGGPADTQTTQLIQDRSNEILANNLKGVKRTPFERAIRVNTTHEYDYIQPYVEDLCNVVDLEAIAKSGLKIGADPLGGSGIDYWEPIADTYGLDIQIVNPVIDPTFSFMTVDHDGKIRMDCSSPYAMAGLIKQKNRFDISFANDPDYDRHGIVTKSKDLMNPNHYLTVAIWYLFQHRPAWPEYIAIGKTLVSSLMINRVANHINRTLCEVPVGFKWFVDGLLNGTLGFGGEESAGASFLRHNGTVWTTDKDGILMNLLSAEIMAVTGRDPGAIYESLQTQFGETIYERIDAPATTQQKAVLKNLSADKVSAQTLAGDRILSTLTHAPCNEAHIGGLKVITENGWFAARPSGTEDIYKIYSESLKGLQHLKWIQDDAQKIINTAFSQSGTDI